MTAQTYFNSLYEDMVAQCPLLNNLDASVGDGDHGTTMVRGLTHATQAPDSMRAKAFMRASGGASGTLFGLILYEIEKYFDNSDTITAGLAQALARICDLGDVQQGDKSMVDALAPAVQALQAGESLSVAVQKAQCGRDNTKTLPARCGRAQYVENQGVGHLDPGAVSVCILLKHLLPQQNKGEVS